MTESSRKFSLDSSPLYLQGFCSNFIKTSKYNILTFFPSALLLQFLRYANVYFLVIAILQSIPIISPLSSFSSWTPLLFVLTISLIREGFEDIYRQKSDREVNAAKCQIYDKNTKNFIEKTWGEIIVSDIIALKNNDYIPADMVILSCNNDSGACFIETASLDGEKALKIKISVIETINKVNPEGGFQIFGDFVFQAPNSNLHEFEGSFNYEEQRIFLGIKQLLLRGAVLRNTKWVVGVVMYTGMDTKLMKNSSEFRNKQSNIERTLNGFLIWVLIFEIICCLISAILCGIWTYTSMPDYLYKEYDAPIEGVLMFFTYLILNSTMIPISLIVSLELVKLAQGYFISVDEDLYSHKRQKYAKVSTTSINEELGQIDYIFTDKTGTLTCNEMIFKFCVIGDEVYGEKTETTIKTEQTKKGDDLLVNYQEWFQKKNNQKSEIIIENTNSGFYDQRLNSLIEGKQKIDGLGDNLENIQKIDLTHEFLKVLSLCHECVCENEEGKEMKYQGPSPDEIALVDFAKKHSYCYQGTLKKTLKLDIMKQTHDYELLHLFEFNSDRKRMSIIIRDHEVIKLYIKGADNVIKERLDKNKLQPFLQKIEFSLDEFSKLGLRTLCIAFRIISKEEYAIFTKKYEELLTVEKREKKIFELAETIEKDLLLIGATIVEDRLQDDVSDVLHDFIQANIKVWMLTGDKLETAENIAKSCSLIQPEFSILRLNIITNASQDLMKEKLIEIYEITQLNKKIHKQKALLIEGISLSQIFSDEILKDIFIDIIENCETVICCRVTSKQKAEVVRLIKDYLGKITLAIGDGANDVNMIQEAHLGVGIYGLEGMRAVQVSDFAIGEFKYLWKLVLVHGRWCYLRISEMILYFFYKNMVFTIIQFYFSFVSAFSGQSIYDDSYIVFFNLIFTSLPLMVRAIMEKDVYYMVKKDKYEGNKNELKELSIIKKLYPKFYYKGPKNKLFNRKRYVNWVVQGLAHGAIIFGFCCIVFYYNILNIDGYTNDIWLFSIFLYSCLIIVVDAKLAAYTQSWTMLFVISLLLTSLIFYFAYILISSEISSLQVYSTAFVLYVSPCFYFLMFLTVALVFILDLLVIYFKQNYRSGMVEKGKELMKMKKLHDETFAKNLNIEELLRSKINESRNEEKKEIMVVATEEIPLNFK